MKNKSVDEKVSETLNMEYVVDGVQLKPTKQIKPYEPEVNADYKDVRQNLRYIIDSGQTAIDGILKVASEGESPRAYEVVSQLIKSVSEANKDLIGLHKQIKEIKKEDPNDVTSNKITNNTLFVGSTKELQEMVKQNFKQIRHDMIDAEVIDGKQE